MDKELLYGYLSVIGAIILFGSYAVPIKLKRVSKTGVSPMILQVYYSIAVFLSSWLVLIYVDISTNPRVLAAGAIGGAMWAIANTFAVAAIGRIGISPAISIWAGITVIVSFLWGVLAFPNSNVLTSVWMAIVAVVLLVAGIVGISLSSYRRDEPADVSMEVSLELVTYYDEPSNAGNYVLGVVFAIVMGLLNGSLGVPIQFISNEMPAGEVITVFIPFAIAAAVVSPIIAAIGSIAQRKLPKLHIRATFIPAIVSGLTWNLGSYCALHAIVFLGISVGYTLPQLSLVVNGIWGIFVFGEIQGKRRLIVWTTFLFVLLAGAILLSYSKK